MFSVGWPFSNDVKDVILSSSSFNVERVSSLNRVKQVLPLVINWFVLTKIFDCLELAHPTLKCLALGRKCPNTRTGNILDTRMYFILILLFNFFSWPVIGQQVRTFTNSLLLKTLLYTSSSDEDFSLSLSDCSDAGLFFFLNLFLSLSKKLSFFLIMKKF